jgi:ubiquitin C-terminal hydrolase
MEKYCKNNNILELLNISEQDINFIILAAQKSLEIYTDKNNIYNIRSQTVLDMLSEYNFPNVNCEFGLFKNINNSCYIDSILLPLLLPTILGYDNFIYDSIINSNPTEDCSINIRDSLVQIIKHIKQKDIIKVQKDNSKTICIDFRNLLRTYCSQYMSQENAFYTSRMQESGEFLTFILDRFTTDVAVRISKFKYINTQTKKNHTEQRTNPISSVVVSVPFAKIQNQEKPTNIQQYLQENTEAIVINPTYNKVETNEKLIESPFIIFNIFRKQPYGTFNFSKSPIVPTKFLTLDSGQKFYLYAVTIYTPGHYTCYLLCGNTWYYYDDMRPSFEKVGSFKKLLLSKPNPITNGTQYFYNILPI